REKHWMAEARKVFYWFLGDNDLRAPLFDFTTGGCRDGLHADRVNENQGAESTLAWLMSLLQMHELQMEQNLGGLPADMSVEDRPVEEALQPSEAAVEVRGEEHAVPDRNDQ
ncbi:MAG TPA: hypothetical protein VMZ50_04015, partial [Phycisphaerae bacterium]|nr:hypothetical protein [Phycisphaerae bacterium]